MADYEDDFYSDGEETKKDNALSAIVELPSGSEAADSQASIQGDTNNSDEHDSDLYDDDDIEEVKTSARTNSARRKKRRKAKNGVDMTPPDKLLKKAESRIRKLTKHNKGDTVIKELIRCVALSRIVYGDGHWKIASAYANLAQGYFDLKNYAPQTLQHAETARSIMMSGVQMSSSSDKASIMQVLMRIFYSLGRANTVQKKYGEAEQFLQKAEKIAEERSKISSVRDDEIEEWDILLYQAMARLYAKQQKHAMAMEYYEKQLDVMDKKYGNDSLELIPVYQSMGKLEQSKGKHADHEKAIENFLQAHSIASANYKENSIEIADTARALASAYANVGEPDAETSAESYLNDCLATYQGTYGPQHAKTLDVQDELARVYVRSDRGDEAISNLKSSMDDKVEVYGDLSSEVAEAYKLIGSIQLSQGDPEKAIHSLKKCLDIETLVHGTNSKKTKDTQKTIDVLMSNPNIKSKLKKSKTEELKDRPRFTSIINRGSKQGGFKPQ